MKTIKRIKKLVIFAGLAGIGLFFYACVPAYVETEPTYVEVARPEPPSSIYIWIEGDWVWSSSTRMYVRNSGHWAKPEQDRTYVKGYWEKTPKGHHWVAGRWQKQDRKENKHGR